MAAFVSRHQFNVLTDVDTDDSDINNDHMIADCSSASETTLKNVGRYITGIHRGRMHHKLFLIHGTY